jgi:hypothetical protein
MAEETKTPEIQLTRAQNFWDSYANNVRIESSVWDFRLIFGNLDQGTTPSTVKLQNSVYIPWAQAKLLLYFLHLHVMFHEKQDGPLQVPVRVVPPPMETVFPDLEKEPGGQAILERARKLHVELFGGSGG